VPLSLLGQYPDGEDLSFQIGPAGGYSGREILPGGALC